MPGDDKIKYSDIIQPDDSIEKLVKQLSELNQSYEATVGAIKAGADRIAQALKTASGASKEGRKSIDEAAIATSRLERAQKELKLAMTDTGKQIAWLKAQTIDQNKASVENQRYLSQAITSYDRLKSDLKQSTSLYKSLTEAEREETGMGQQLLQEILELKNRIKALDDQMKPHIESMTEVQKAEQRLAYLESEEGQKLLDLKAKISEVTAARRQHKASLDPLARAQEKLAFAESGENQQLKLYSTRIKEANRLAQLRAIINDSAEGSYNRLSAQYALNKIKLNQMSQAEREATDSGKKLESETNKIYEQMIKLQEATGNYRLSVGHYQRAWNGLNVSISQAVRELPAAAVSLNTFFLGISNNIPMVVDEIKKLRFQNERLRAEGKKTVSVTKQIAKALFGWNTALVILLTVFSMWGGQIIEWIGSLFKGKQAVISLSEALDNINEELKNTNAGYGQNTVALKRLRDEWKDLKSTASKNQWLKENNSEFDKLGIAINGVAEAENVFVDNTEAVIRALRLRAKAEAAQKLAAEQYEKALISRNEAEVETAKGPSGWDRFKSSFVRAITMSESGGAADSDYTGNISAENYAKDRVRSLNDEAKAAEKTGDAYLGLAEDYEKAAKAELAAAEIRRARKKASYTKRAPRDLTSTLNRNSIRLEKKYEESVTELQKDEFAKRRKNIADQIQYSNNKLREMYRKNEEYVKNVEGKYRALTESQKKQIDQQQKWISDTIANNLKLLSYQLQQVQKEQQVNALRIRRETINSMDPGQASTAAQSGETLISTQVSVSQDASGIEQSLVRERKLVEENLELEYALILETNDRLRKAGDEHARSEEEILIELNKKKLELWASYDNQILSIRRRNIEDQLNLVKKGSEEELQLLLQQNEIARQAALSANAAKPASEQVSSSAIDAKFSSSASQIKGKFEMTGFDEQQELNRAVFNEVERSENEITKFKLEQERDRWQKQIALAESGGLKWSQAQIDAAKSTVRGIDREISKLNNFINELGEKGLGGTLLDKLGFNDSQIDALGNAANIVIEQLQSIADAEVEMAKKAVEMSEERVGAAQKAYDAEVEARNNGFASNVATAKKELQQEKKNQQEKQKMLEEAQKRQEALNTVVQASSLITASANLWSSFSSIPVVGPALALAAISTMWTSFAVAKVRAKQATAGADEYGEGGLEFLEGGSHASGNDIDLGTKNRKNRQMRAEGGEALAIINKKKTRKYKKILPDIVDSLNKGTFEDKYLNAFATPEGLNISLNSSSSDIDLSRIEKDVSDIRKRNEVRYYSRPDGSMVIQRKNVKRIIKN